VLPSRLLLQVRWLLVMSPSRHLLLQVLLLLGLARGLLLLLAALLRSCLERHPSYQKPQVRQRQQAHLPSRCCITAGP
jgi:hypothetical protein